MRGLEPAGPILIGARKCPFAITEQFGIQQRFGEGRAIDRHERPLPARAQGMNVACQQFLAGPGLTADQHRYLRRRDLVQIGKQIPGLGILEHQCAGARR